MRQLRLPLRAGELFTPQLPLVPALLAKLFCQQRFFFVSKYLQTLCQLLELFVAKQQHPCGLGFAQHQLLAGGFMFFKDHRRNLTVNFGPGQLF